MRLCTLAFHYPSSDEQNWPGPYIYTVCIWFWPTLLMSGCDGPKHAAEREALLHSADAADVNLMMRLV